MKAAAEGSGGVIEDWIRAGGSVDDRDTKAQNTMLMVASGKCKCEEGRCAVLNMLLDEGHGRPGPPAALDLGNAKGYTALMMAAAYNQHPCAAKLLASGANMSARASDGQTALEIAVARKAVEVEELLRAAGGGALDASAEAGQKDEV